MNKLTPLLFVLLTGCAGSPANPITADKADSHPTFELCRQVGYLKARGHNAKAYRLSRYISENRHVDAGECKAIAQDGYQYADTNATLRLIF